MIVIIVRIWLGLELCLYAHGKGNGNSFFGSFSLANSSFRNGCFESTNQCDIVNNLLVNSTCFNLKLLYKYTFENKLVEYFEFWDRARAIPKCWVYLRIILCVIKYPECSRSNNEWFVSKPSREICQATKRECSLLLTNDINNSTGKSNNLSSLLNRMSSLLDCDKYPPDCPVESYSRMIQSSDSYNCQWPMVNTVQKTLWIKGFDGCSFHCKTPFFNEDDYQLSKLLFGSIGLIFFVLNLFVLITFIIHQIQHSDYKWHPMLLNLFIIHFYMLIASCGWMIQLIPTIGHSVVCRDDGALQIREPQVKIGQSIWCVTVFSMIYFSLFAASLTSVSFFYSILSVISQYSSCWAQNQNENTQENNSNSICRSKIPFLTNKFRFSLRKNNKKKIFNFQTSFLPDMKQDKDEVKLFGIGTNCDSINSRSHSLSRQLFVILISLSLLIISLTIGEIKGDPLSGICFVANDSMVKRICLSLLPLTVVLVILSIIMNIIITHIRIIQKRLNLYASSQQKIHSKRMSKTATFYVFMLIYLWIFWCFSVYTHSYIYSNEKLWHDALKDQFVCNLKQSLLPSLSIAKIQCPLVAKPSFNIFILHGFGYFSLNAIFLFCAIFNKQSILVWKKVFVKFLTIQKSTTSNESQSNGKSQIDKLYFGLHNKTLLDSIWNPGIFVYLVYKSKNKTLDKEIRHSTFEDKAVTMGSFENSSASFCIYQRDGSLRSCVSMPPINVLHPQNGCQCSQNLKTESEVCPTLENFLKGTQNFIGENIVRRSNSYAGRPCMITKASIGNVSIPNSCFNNDTANKHKCFSKPSLRNSLATHSGIVHLTCSNCNCCQNVNQNSIENTHRPALNGCISMSHLTARRNTIDNTSLKYNKSLRRYSVSSDRKHEKGVSSKSTLNRRKRVARYSVSPKSVTKTFNNQSTVQIHLANPSNRNSSSFSAESYNSYNLMSQQTGGRWRDICRTRMTLHDVMIWAKAASQSGAPMHSICHNPLCNYSLPMDNCGHINCAPKLLAQNKQCLGSKPLSMVYPNQNVSTTPFKGNNKTEQDNQTKETKPINKKDLIKIKVSKCNDSMKSDNTSDEFNSEDEVISAENSLNDEDKGSGEFCSDDEVISLINSEEQ